MSRPAAYIPEAVDDIDQAHAAYEARRTGLGDRFLQALRRRVDAVRSNPQLYAVFRRGVRAVPLNGFPYVVYYRERDTDLLVIAVQHGRRSARGWRDRV